MLSEAVSCEEDIGGFVAMTVVMANRDRTSTMPLV